MRRPVWNGLVQRNNVILWYSIACVWVVVFFIYKQSAIVTDGISGGDSAELVLTGMQGGSPHPPGYPLIGLWIHFGYHFLLRLDIVHNFEQFLHYTALGIGASAASLYALFLCRFVDTILGGCVGSLLFVLSEQVWRYSLHIEVFGLNNFFISLLMNLLYAVHANQHNMSSRKFQLAILGGAFFSGLALANQQTVVIYSAPWILWVFYVARGILWSGYRPTRILVYCAMLFCLGLSIYLYLPFTHPYTLPEDQADSLTHIVEHIRETVYGTKHPQHSRDHPVYSWGNTANWRGFFNHVFRGDYGSFQLFPARNGVPQSWWARLSANLAFYFEQNEFNATVRLLFMVGVFRQLWKLKQRKWSDVGHVLLAAYLLYLVGFFSLCNIPLDQGPIMRGIFARFFQQPNLLAFVFVVYGASVLEKMILWGVFIVTNQRIDRVIVQLSLFVIFLSVLWVHFQVSHPEYGVDHLPFVGMRGDLPTKNVFHTWTEEVLRSLPPHSLLMLYGDMETNILHYYNFQYRIRPDITLLSIVHMSYPWWTTGNHRSAYPHINFPGSHLATGCQPNIDKGANFPFSMNAFLDANLPQRSVFSLLQWPVVSSCSVHQGVDRVPYEERYTTVSYGMTFMVIPVSEYWGIDKRLRLLEDKLPDLALLDDFQRDFSMPGKSASKECLFDPSEWESRLIWHYAQPHHTKAYLLYQRGLWLHTHDEDAGDLFIACVDIYTDLFLRTCLPLPNYMQEQANRCLQPLL